jgi:tetratricopeptide (TPR) repeat protein
MDGRCKRTTSEQHRNQCKCYWPLDRADQGHKHNYGDAIFIRLALNRAWALRYSTNSGPHFSRREEKMLTLSPELIVFIFGILSVCAALEHIPDVRHKGSLFIALFAVGLLTQLSTHFFQYRLAVTNRTEAAKESEASTAIALYAYTLNDISLLRETSKDSYLVGYRLFKNGQWDEAIPFFRQAIYEQRFAASSYFVQAHMATHDKEGRLDPTKDWTSGFELLDKALSNNDEYAPAYYELASLYANSARIDGALKILPKAVFPLKFGRVPCTNLNSEKYLNSEWAPIRTNTEFIKIKEQCKRVHGIK